MSDFYPGMVSVTFRQLSARAIIDLAKEAELLGIEWGGDVHVPHGDEVVAREVAAQTRDAGLKMPSYGSYYRMAESEPELFEQVLASALILGVDVIRVWPGRRGSADADADYRARVEADGQRIAEMAAAAGLRIACEWHANTLTDTAASGVALLEAVNHPAFKTFWQVRTDLSLAACLQDLEAALPHVIGAHVFQWQNRERQPLAAGIEVWRDYLERLRAAGPMFAMLEFVKDDEPEQLRADAKTLRSLCGE